VYHRAARWVGHLRTRYSHSNVIRHASQTRIAWHDQLLPEYIAALLFLGSGVCASTAFLPVAVIRSTLPHPAPYHTVRLISCRGSKRCRVRPCRPYQASIRLAYCHQRLSGMCHVQRVCGPWIIAKCCLHTALESKHNFPTLGSISVD
jgi:hypothetical protein